MKNVELLVPAKDFETLEIAVKNGAHAVYCGLETYNARWKGKNFHFAGLKEAVKYAHFFNVKVFLTVNIIFKEFDLSIINKIIQECIMAEVDAVIVQDLGVADYILKNYPRIIVHASTQTAVSNHYGVEVLERMGIKRVILARELSIDEIATIRKACPYVELEIFAHGGQCVAYSGQCYSSGYIFGLSGNRGMCEALCCEEYTLFQDGVTMRSGSILKLDDLYCLDIMQKVKESGINSIKIQGRTRSNKYLEIVTSLYWKSIQNPDEISKRDLKLLDSVYSRRLTHGNLLSDNESQDYCSETDNNYHSALEKRELITIKFDSTIEAEINICLLYIDSSQNYSLLSEKLSSIYIPYVLFEHDNNVSVIKQLCSRYQVFILMPQLILERYASCVYSSIASILEKYTITGIILSNISDLYLLDMYKCLRFRGNYTLNMANHLTADYLYTLGLEQSTLSLEIDEMESKRIIEATKLKIERMVYGHPILMTMKYCPILRRNECKVGCEMCADRHQFILQNSEFGFDVSLEKNPPRASLFAKKILSLRPDGVTCDSLRCDFLYESIDEINCIIDAISKGEFLIGKQYKNSIHVL